ncbi:MAG TPA: two-component regulator propeller domain-containing protein, partial [Acidobacteriaceae bacterium]|nr:two-component regulator propeller domain-containing protein [Acidobacteriaceae bacterium]
MMIQPSHSDTSALRSMERSLRSIAGAAIIALAVFSSSSTGWALPVSNLQLSEYQKQDWQVEDGLPENNVRMIAQRPDGTLLLASSSGIASFDGQHFRALPINDSAKAAGDSDIEAVNAILPVGNEELWIGTDGRGVLHQTSAGTVNISERAGLYNERIRNLCKDSNGVLWIATQNGIERYTGGRLEVVKNTGMISGDLVSPFAEDGHGGMFFVTSSGLFHWQSGVARQFALGLPNAGSPVALYRDPPSQIWIGTTKGVVELVQERREATAISYHPVLRAKISAPISVLLSDATGDLWIGTRGYGLWRLNSDGLSRWSVQNGLPDDAIRSLFIDDENNLWIGMLSGGLSRWRKGALAPYGDAEGFHATYSANVLADSHGDLWLGTWGKGLFRRHNGKLIPTNPPNLPMTTPI